MTSGLKFQGSFKKCSSNKLSLNGGPVVCHGHSCMQRGLWQRTQKLTARTTRKDSRRGCLSVTQVRRHNAFRCMARLESIALRKVFFCKFLNRLRNNEVQPWWPCSLFDPQKNCAVQGSSKRSCCANQRHEVYMRCANLRTKCAAQSLRTDKLTPHGVCWAWRRYKVYARKVALRLPAK